MRTVKVNICENDKNGKPSGKVYAFEFRNKRDLFFFEAVDFEIGIPFNSCPNPLNTFTFLSQHYLYLVKRLWHGSTAYNQYEMSLPEALRLLNKVAFSKDFSLTFSADVKINDLIDKGIEIKGSDMDWCNETDEVEASIFDKNQLLMFQN